MAVQQIRRSHDRVQRVVDVMHHPGRELTDRREPPFARVPLLDGKQLSRALTNHSLESLGLRRGARVELVDLSSLLFQLSQERESIGDVALDGHRAAHLTQIVVQRIRAHLDHARDGWYPRDAQHLRTDALTTKGPRG